MSKEYTVEPVEESTKECKTCKKGISNTQKGMVVLSIYILVSSIYGTIKIIEWIGSLL